MATTKISEFPADNSERVASTTTLHRKKGREEYDNDQDYYDDPESDFEDPYLEQLYQPIKLSPEEFQRFVDNCIFGPPRQPTQKMLRAMSQARELGIE